jgi:hypothetical protein
VDADLDTLATALYVTTDDLLKGAPDLAPWRPAVGIAPKLSDAELVTLAVLQALLGFGSEARWLRYARAHLGGLFPYLPKQPGYNKRLRAAADLIRQVIRALASDTRFWTDDVWVADSTPVECGRSRETTKRSALAGWAPSGYCASPHAGSGAAAAPGLHPARPTGRLRAGRRQSRRTPGPAGHPGRRPASGGGQARPDPHHRQALLRPPVPGRAGRPGGAAAAPSPQGRAATGRRPPVPAVAAGHRVDQPTFKGQLDLEHHGGHSPAGVVVRVLQRILALTAAIWHNDHTGQPTARSLVAYDH